MKQIIYVCVVTVLLYPKLCYGCPTGCSCENSLTTDCFEGGLTEVPSGIPVTTEILTLSSNLITSVPEGAFTSLVNLKELVLRNNKITSVPAGLFSSNVNLYYVSLGTNYITSLPDGLFSNNPALGIVSFASNQITSLPEGFFSTNPALFSVSLNSNQITSLPGGFFSNNPALKNVYIYYNNITSIPEGLLSNNPALREFDCEGNQLTSVPAGLFSSNPALDIVYLNDNQITSLPEGLFSNNPALSEINLYNNQIKTVSSNIFPDALTVSAFIELGNNPVLCCNMTDLIDWIQDQSNVPDVEVSCTDTPSTARIDFGSFNTSVCPQVDGQWGNWSESNCASTCGVYSITRTRECNNPEPSEYGQRCQGEASDETQCIYQECPSEKEFNWKPLVIGLVVGICVIIGVIALIALLIMKSNRKKITNGV